MLSFWGSEEAWIYLRLIRFGKDVYAFNPFSFFFRGLKFVNFLNATKYTKCIECE